MTAKKAIILLSGGLDSTTCLAIAQSLHYDLYAISYAYGQKHQAELDAARRAAAQFEVKAHRIVALPTEQFIGSSLTSSLQDIPDANQSTGIPSTYVPARNTIFLSLALGWAEIIGCYDIFIGVSAIDYSGYPDCRPEFIQAFQNMANLATKASLEGQPTTIHTPLLHLSKAATIQKGVELGVDYQYTISCYRANELGHACGECDSCDLRSKGFREAKIADPTRYSALSQD